ncbi:TPA: hypothetical protein I0H43_RS11265 [Enterococcus faecalis]|nr:hypothetical protein [Enterococcus faecalis]
MEKNNKKTANKILTEQKKQTRLLQIIASNLEQERLKEYEAAKLASKLMTNQNVFQKTPKLFCNSLSKALKHFLFRLVG